MNNKRISFATLGCKVNQYETSTVADQFADLGYSVVEGNAPADIYVINTCTVTNRTDFKSRNLIRRALKIKANNPEVKVFVTGCYSQRSKDEIKALGDVDLIIDNQHKTDIHKWFESFDYEFLDIMKAESFHYVPVTKMLEHTRAFQKIQDGCDFYCSYCAVPYARGHSRSCKFSDVITQAKILADNGYKEIVLGGVNLGLYRDGNHQLGDVLIALNDIEGLELIRISSIEPQLLTNSLLETIATLSKVCPHFHIPLQSGTDATLERMKRRYRATDVSRLVDKIRKYFPHAAIGMDVITAFPGESDEDFKTTYDFIDSISPAYLHVFTYSKRKGTPAAEMRDQIHGSVAEHRSKQLSELNEVLKKRLIESIISSNCILRGIVEQIDGGVSTALSDHFIRIYRSSSHQTGDLLSGVADSAYADGILIQSDHLD
ncbi:MAG: tRNA (N(6)-L-threonylcarbamoyladenosine(37)-C(2))-methylthiotransferase MtaB [Candidatus Cloacimonetes bacterium HGW-Cloacimonetes-1]|jgi:threonylcarbamoyladenosine tRNA methylthiotransferase MtaB|nr:MAG: tRNA (N(6)-L-threonylcarbamoyladenosine(37)-C(2))-methylthiotransferase MtaB [Candidatus Cloacimonetes bacterium HGW-Cloacimonetes-1]